MAKFQNQTEVVDALRTRKARTVAVGDGSTIGVNAGWWLITHGDGSMSVCDPDTFKILYSPVKRNAAKAKKTAAPRGRPSVYSKKVADAICARLEAGESLRQICADPAMPARSTIMLWLSEHKDFSDHYALAREIHTDDEFDDMAELDRMLVDGAIDAPTHRSLIDSRKWRLSKRNPRKYGDRVDLNHGGTVEITGIADIVAQRRAAGGGGDGAGGQ